jgi:hypothetical protein
MYLLSDEDASLFPFDSLLFYLLITPSSFVEVVVGFIL